MKQYWQRLVLKIDALSLRERAMIFVITTLLLITLVNMFLLDPQFVRQKQLSQQMQQDQAQIAQIQAEIQQRIKSGSVDPDADNKRRLQQIRSQIATQRGVLRDMQKTLVSPDRMPALLEDILKRNGKLRLVALRTLPVSSVNDVVAEADKAAIDQVAAAATAAGKESGPSGTAGLYKHAVEIVVQGSYLEMVRYMVELEAMPWQLFWGKAKLQVDEYPSATLTLTLFTLSLDKKWLNL